MRMSFYILVPAAIVFLMTPAISAFAEETGLDTKAADSTKAMDSKENEDSTEAEVSTDTFSAEEAEKLAVDNLISSEIFHQPSDGEETVDVSISYSKSGKEDLKLVTTGAKNGTIQYEEKLVVIKYMNGVSENLALGVQIDQGSQVNTLSALPQPEIKSKGLGDLTLLAIGDKDIWRYGGEISLSIGDREEQTTSDDGNRYSGGHAVKPFVGVIVDRGNTSLGSKLSYRYRLERDEEDADGTDPEKVTGAHERMITFFVERNYSNGIYYGTIDHQSVSKETSEDGNTGVKTEWRSFTSIHFRAGVRHQLNESIHLLGGFQYSTTENRNTIPEFVKPVDYTATAFQAGVRFIF